MQLLINLGIYLCGVMNKIIKVNRSLAFKEAEKDRILKNECDAILHPRTYSS